MIQYRFRLTPLTPIHVGTGAALEPFEYVVAGDTLYRFAVDDFLLALDKDDQARFVEVLEESVPAARRFVAEHVVTAAGVTRFTSDVSPTARALYDGRIEGAGNPEVHSAIRTGIAGSELPYIPGSSLKGALRTALLYHAMPDDSLAEDARALEASVFSYQRIQDDPFRAFKVGDGVPLAENTRIRTVAVKTRRGNTWSEDVAVLIETIPGVLSDDAEISSDHSVTFDTAFYEGHDYAFRLSPGTILAACRDFYGKHLVAEEDYTSGLPQAAGAYRALVRYSGELPEHACLVRMGWGSGRDATTVAYAVRNAPKPRSRRLTADGFPLGWVELAMFDDRGEPVTPEVGLPGVAPRPTAADGSPGSIYDLREGMELEGTVTNTVGFGAFVDLGIGQDGLIHISQLSEEYVERTEDMVRKGNRVRVRVLSVDMTRERIGLKLLEVMG